MKLCIDFSGGGILEVVMHLMGYIHFSYVLYEDEQLIWDMFEKSGTDHIEALKVCLKNIDIKNIGCISMGDDMGFNSGTMMNPLLMRKYIFPWLEKLV